MVVPENRSGAYFKAREHRKRRRLPFAGRPHPNIDMPYAAWGSGSNAGLLVLISSEIQAAAMPVMPAIKNASS